MPRIVGHLDAGNPDKLFKSDLMVEIRVKEAEYGCALSSGQIVLWLHELEVPEEVIQRSLAVCVVVIGGLPESLEVAVAHL